MIETKNIMLTTNGGIIVLTKYTYKIDSIKVKFATDGLDCNDWTLNQHGDIVISDNAIPYETYDNPHNIPMTIEYEPCELPVPMFSYNTADGLKQAITDLQSLHNMADVRWIASHKFGIYLNQFVVNNYVFLDQFGQTMGLKYEHQSVNDNCFKGVITFEEFCKKLESNNKSFSYCPLNLPTVESRCPHCKQGWAIDNMQDAIVLSSGSNWYHIYCAKVKIYEYIMDTYKYIATQAFEKYGGYEIKAIQNRDDPTGYSGSWFMIFTNDGSIRIGRVRSIIEIEWMEDYKPFKFNGKDENVTKEFSNECRFIHANNIEAAIKYLKMAKLSIIK